MQNIEGQPNPVGFWAAFRGLVLPGPKPSEVILKKAEAKLKRLEEKLDGEGEPWTPPAEA